MSLLKVNLGRRSYDIQIEPGCITDLPEAVRKIHKGNDIAVISDKTVTGYYGQKVLDLLGSAGFHVTMHTVSDGEDSKSFSILQQLWGELLEINLKRDGMVIALGGGVIGDLAGFVASTFLRGIPFVQVPTTLLAQVDSSVGGKVGINHPLGKNLIGNFYQPRFVCIDPEVLTTLDNRDMWAGMAEVVKYGLIWDESFYKFLEKNLENLIELKDWNDVSRMLSVCCKIKAEVVQQDEREGGLRRILNFGHTIGHAIEAVTGYKVYHHGEAVVYGMSFACWVSMKEGFITKSTFERIQQLFKRFIVPPLSEKVQLTDLLDKIKIDKKQSHSGLHVILLESIGKTKDQTVQDLSEWTKGWLDYARASQ